MEVISYITSKIIVNLPKPENKGKFVYFFSHDKDELDSDDKLCFYVWLRNSGDYFINKVWFYSFISIGDVMCVPTKNQQNLFSSIKFLSNHFSGYSKDEYKLPPNTVVDIFYFEIPKEKLKNAGRFEFSYGADNIKKYYFSASWDKDELSQNINSEVFLKFIGQMNKKFHRNNLFKNMFLSWWSVVLYLIIILFVGFYFLKIGN